ncbi:hypothetical protein SDC9_125614 [bioreactor metagenome]|uniref:Uncharacterized protein n=1 Tax=bioreactor metagenome TaxID=1076179 RepID=A0A645CNT3_9ZZZZ
MAEQITGRSAHLQIQEIIAVQHAGIEYGSGFVHAADAHDRQLGQRDHAADFHHGSFLKHGLRHLLAAGQQRGGDQVKPGVEHIAVCVGQVIADAAGQGDAGERTFGDGGQDIQGAAGRIAVADVDAAIRREPLDDVHAGGFGDGGVG